MTARVRQPAKISLFMTPYECALSKKLTQAIELNDNLSKLAKADSNGAAPEAPILHALIRQIKTTDQQFDSQLLRYQDLYEKRMRLSNGTDGCIKQLNDMLWEDIAYQFKPGTLTNGLIRVIYRKIYHLPLQSFPLPKRKPVLHKDVRLHEDSYALLGRYFSWLIDLLPMVNFTPVRSAYCLSELRQRANQFNTLSQQVMNEAEMLRSVQFAQSQLYKQLDLAMSAARGRLLLHKREAQRITM